MRQRPILWTVSSIYIGTAVLLLGAPVTVRSDGPPPVSGFLGDYSELRPHPKKKGLLVYYKRIGVLAPYSKFVVEQPVVLFHPEARGTEVDPEELEMLADFLREALVAELEASPVGYEVVETSGEGVLVLRLAITDVEPVEPARNVGSSVAGAVTGVGLLVPRVDLGRAAIECEMVDGASGERLAAVVASKKGRRFGGKIKGAKRWGDVKGAFRSWAKKFRKRLDQLHDEPRGGPA